MYRGKTKETGKKERKKEGKGVVNSRERKRGDLNVFTSNVLQEPTSLKQILACATNALLQIPSKKSPSSSSTFTVSQNNHVLFFLFLPELCGLFRPLSWSEFFHREKQESKERSKRTFPPPTPAYLFSLFSCPLYLSIISFSFSRYKAPFFIALPISLPCSYLSPYIHFLVFLSFPVFEANPI